MASKETKSKHNKCGECGLRIRCGDLEKHKEGIHHKQRMQKRKESKK